LNHSGTTEIKLTVEDGNPANVQVDRDKWWSLFVVANGWFNNADCI
jgi:hypothetical protein